MNVLFAHDHILYKTPKSFLSNGGISYDVLKRYLEVFDEIKVISRQKILDDTSGEDTGFTVANGENTQFHCIPDFKNPRNFLKIREAHGIIKKIVMDSDYVIARLPSSIGNIAIDYAKKNNKPYLIEVAGCAWDAYWNHSLGGKLVAFYNFKKMKKLIIDSPYVIYVTEGFLQKRYPTKGKSIACSNVMLNEFDDDVLSRRQIKINELAKSKKIILGTIGAINVKYKGHKYVFQAIANIKNIDKKDIVYQIVGGGSNKRLERLANKYRIRDNIEFIGSLKHSDVLNWLETIDIYIQPSDTEGLPRALIEAMSKGLPSIGSNAGGIPELLEQQQIFKIGINTKKNLSNVLLDISNKDLIIQSKKNYEKAKEYEKTIIEERRFRFLVDFKDSK